jgi:hypothetical protein
LADVISVTRGGDSRAESWQMNHTRIRTSIPVEICAYGRVVEGTVRNASDEGMFVETRSIPAQGEPISVRLNAQGEDPIELMGLVWWTTEDSPNRHRERGFGLRLLEGDERYALLLSGLG